MKRIVTFVLATTLQYAPLTADNYQPEYAWTAAYLVQQGLDLKTTQFFNADNMKEYSIALEKAVALDGTSALSSVQSVRCPEMTTVNNTVNELKDTYFALVINNEIMTVKNLPQLLALQVVFHNAYTTLTKIYNEGSAEQWVGLLLEYIQHDLLMIAKAVNNLTELNYKQQYLSAQK